MKAETLFISDLHLSVDRPETVDRFLHFLANRAQGVDALYILGDLFEAYIGDDDDSRLNVRVKSALKRLSHSGVQVYFQHGNRDFLIGELFSVDTGVNLLNDYAVIDLYGEKVLITHGDLLCTDDKLYQEARIRVRNPAWKANALSKPCWMRRLYARWYRLKSHLNKAQKEHFIMDANPDTVVSVMRQYAVTQLIHGHTHRPAVHEFEIDGKPARRFVLAEWGELCEALCWNGKGEWRIESVI